MNNWGIFLVFHAYINEMHGSRSKIPSKKSHPYINDVKFLALIGAPYIYDISRLRVKSPPKVKGVKMNLRHIFDNNMASNIMTLYTRANSAWFQASATV
jgi:hypothetical protein